MNATSSPLTRKQTRTIERALSHLTGIKSFIDARTIEDLRGASIAHDLQLPDGRTLILSDSGLKNIRALVCTLHEADHFHGHVDYADLWNASKRAYALSLTSGQMAETAQEWIEGVSAQLSPEIRTRVFVVPFVGLELQGIDDIDLGPLKIVRPGIRHLVDAGVDHEWTDVPTLIRRYREWELWLIGRARGTHGVAEARFRTLATLTAGLMAVAAAVMLTDGAVGIFISPNMTGHDADGDATWFSWSESGENFTLHKSGLRGLPFQVDANLRDQLANASVVSTAIRIFQSDTRTPLEEAVARGFHWFADAHRDSTPVMQLVKYWSCIETFFSSDQKDVTRSLSVGVASVLVFGGFSFRQIAEYQVLKRRVAKLYALRSKAVHRASIYHVRSQDVAELSRYAGQLLLNALSFVERGYSTPSEIKRRGERIDARMQNQGATDS